MAPVSEQGSSKARPGTADGPGATLTINNRFLELAIVAVSYFGLTEGALLLPALNTVATTPLWPPTGVALSIVLLRGNRIWPAIGVGSLSACALSANTTMFKAAAAAMATTLAALAGAWLINRWSGGRKTFASTRCIANFVIISFVPTAAISSGVAIGALALADTFRVGPSLNVSMITWTAWWLFDAVAMVMIAPVVLLWAGTPLDRSSKAIGEAAGILFAAIAIGVVSFSPSNYLDGLLPYRSALGIFVLLPLMWAALRGDQRNAATAALAFCACLLWSYSAGTSSFPSGGLNRSPFFLMALLIGASVTPLIVAATIAAHRDNEARLLSLQLLLKLQFDQTKLALKNAKRQLQIFIEGVADYAIFMLDTSGRIISWNTTAQSVIGYDTEEIVGKHFAIFYRPDERRAGEPNRVLELASLKGKHEVEGWRVRKDGTPFYATGAFTAIRDDAGKLIGFANIIRDATERRDTQEKLFEAREQLATAQKMEAIGKLTGGIAHDFNNLLMIIGGNADTVRRLLDPKLPRAIEAIQIAARRGESLTRQLLTFSRRQHLSPMVVDLPNCIRDMRTLIESSLRGNIVYHESIAPDIWRIKVDLAELELAVVNIAVNARDAMPDGGEFTLTAENVKVRNDQNNAHQEFVALGFTDTGLGIPRNLLSKIFDPFFTTKEVGKGTGLGLSQVYGFAHQAGGWVQADSKVGRGTKVTVYLPHYAGAEPVETQTAALEARQLERPVVLVVDDSTDVAEVTSTLFEQLGYETVYGESAEAALRFLAEGPNIDLVFSDIVMPGTMDGVGLAREIQSLYPNLPVVLTTGYSDAAQAAPPNLRILRKPFDAATLKGFLEETMEAQFAS